MFAIGAARMSELVDARLRYSGGASPVSVIALALFAMTATFCAPEMAGKKLN